MAELEQQKAPQNWPDRLLRSIGSLRLAGLLMVLWMVAMAAATVHEVQRGTEPTLKAFYGSSWFAALLGMIGVNVLAAMVLRFPFKRSHAGFVAVHAGILIVLVGALMTKRWAIDGQLALAEGQTAAVFAVDQPVLALTNLADGRTATVDLPPSVFDGLKTVETPAAPQPALGDVTASALRYLPDSAEREEVLDDNPREHDAVEVRFSTDEGSQSLWLFADHADETAMIGYQVHQDEADFARTITTQPTTQPADKGRVMVEYHGQRYEFSVDEVLGRQVALEGTDLRMRLVRYLPHATVGADRKLVNASDRPVNPAIEVEFEGPQGTERRLAFARFPDFGSMHGHDQAFEGLKVNLSADVEPISETPITVISGPDDRLAVRFRLAENDVRTRQIALNQVVETPWPALSLTVLQRFTHARVDRTVVPIEPPQSNRTPAVKVEVHSPHGSSQTWVRFGQQATVELDQQAYRLAFGRKELPLGAAVRLEKFQIGFYPGRQQPRSFESHLTVIDPVTERAQSKLISMNRPAAVGPYTLYQSSYNTDGQQTVSFLSVSWDPGKPVVFTGYILVTVGFVAVIATRAVNRRKRVAA